jgi:hypothetical protein
MTASERIEEILFEADAQGLRQEVIDYSVELREINPRLEKVDSIEVAYSLILQALDNE